MTSPKPKKKHASIVEAAKTLDKKIKEEGAFRLKGLSKHALTAMDAATETHEKNRTEEVDETADYKVDETGTMVDAYGVPFLDSGTARRSRATRRRKRTPEQRLVIQKRIQDARALLMLFMSVPDIVRALAPVWKVSQASCYKYVAIARKQNKAMLGRSAEEWKSDSLSFWTRKLQEANTRKQRAMQDYGTAQQIVKEIDGRLNAATKKENASLVLALANMMKEANKRIDNARRVIHATDVQVEMIADRIDRLVGNNSPTRLALTDAEGNSLIQHVREPITQAEREIQLASLLKGLSPAQLAHYGLKPVEQLDASLVSSSESEAPDPDAGAIYPIEIDTDQRDE